MYHTSSMSFFSAFNPDLAATIANPAPCYLYANVNALVPSSLMNAGVLRARYS